jgi:hypothetical protein
MYFFLNPNKLGRLPRQSFILNSIQTRQAYAVLIAVFAVFNLAIWLVKLGTLSPCERPVMYAINYPTQ